jgi:hypothetical protein
MWCMFPSGAEAADSERTDAVTKTRIASAKVVAKSKEPTAWSSRRPLVIALAAATLLALLAVGGWIVWTALERPLPVASDRAELLALDERLTAVQGAIGPIAATFTSRPATGVIDVGSYRARIAEAGRLVDSTNGLTVSSPDAMEIRDLIITGGSQVLEGLSVALDALQADEASATIPAASEVDEGLAALQDARTKLDALLGKKSGT